VAEVDGARPQGTDMSPPPRLAHRLLAARLVRDEREELIGDLDEQFQMCLRRRGPGAARRWYWRQTIVLLLGFAMHRRDLVSTAHERTRGRWAAGNLALDARHALRALRHSPAFSMAALLSLTFGIGLSTSVFSLVNGILLKPLPVPDADRIVRLGELETPHGSVFDGMINTGERRRVTLRDVSAGVWQQTSTKLAAFAPINTIEATVRVPVEPVRLTVAEIGPQFFEVYRLTPAHGRLLGAADEAPVADAVAVVTSRFWSQRLGRRPDVINLFITINGQPTRIVGVIPPALDFLKSGVDVFRPMRFTYPDPGRHRLFGMNMDMTARLAPDATIDDVIAEGKHVLRSVAMANPAFFDGTVPIPQVRVQPLADEIIDPVRPALTMLSAGVSGLLAAMCASLATLVLTRNSARRHEVAMRLALGASRWRITRPLLFEQLILAGLGGVLGGLSAWMAVRLLPHVAPADLPRLGEVQFDFTSLSFAGGAAIVTGAFVGILPAWQTPSTDLRQSTTAARGSGALRSALVAGQVALATMLLVVAGLFGRSLQALTSVNPGYRPDGVITFQIARPDLIWREKGRLHLFYSALTSKLAEYPGVTAAGVTTALPLHTGGSAGTYPIDGRAMPEPDARPRGQSLGVTRDYLRALGTQLISGRLFNEQDTPESEAVCLVNDVFAARYFPGEDPIGHRLRVRANASARIIGVVASMRIGALTTDAPPAVIQLATQQPELLGYGHVASGVAVRTGGDPEALIPAIRSIVRELEPEWPIYNVERLDVRLSRTFAQPRFYTIALTLFAALAVATAVLGLYGVIAYAVERRRIEFGIRRALGAGERHILRLATGRAALLAGIGAAAGSVIAATTAGWLRATLFGIHPLDPAAYGSAIALVAAVVLAASWIPARRALQVDPARALRVE
jgi:predicted permease